MGDFDAKGSAMNIVAQEFAAMIHQAASQLQALAPEDLPNIGMTIMVHLILGLRDNYHIAPDDIRRIAEGAINGLIFTLGHNDVAVGHKAVELAAPMYFMAPAGDGTMTETKKN